MNILKVISNLQTIAKEHGGDVDVTCAKDVPHIHGREPRVIEGASDFRADRDGDKVVRIQI